MKHIELNNWTQELANIDLIDWLWGFAIAEPREPLSFPILSWTGEMASHSSLICRSANASIHWWSRTLVVAISLSIAVIDSLIKDALPFSLIDFALLSNFSFGKSWRFATSHLEKCDIWYSKNTWLPMAMGMPPIQIITLACSSGSDWAMAMILFPTLLWMTQMART